MKIYTKTGDEGNTGLFGGKRLPKDDLRIEAYGTVDELNSHIGLLRDQEASKEQLSTLLEIQDRLFTMGSLLATDPEKSNLKLPELHESDILLLEKEIDKMNESLPEMKSFVLPGGHQTVSFCHIARCVCRRAERRVVTLAQVAQINPLIVKYLNRLSDYLFVLSRMFSHKLNAPETPWKPRM
jgi:cob(I)alamin adenosyltransferase